MPTVVNGKFTLKEVMVLTYEYAKTRFEYRQRDVVKRIVVKKVKTYEADRKNQPTISYLIESKSYPQYRPYIDREGRRQRKVSHKYDVVLQMDRLSLNTKAWKARLGAQGKWEHHPPQDSIKALYRETREKWKKRYGTGLREQIKKHKRGAKFLDVGDWNAQVKGINGDFLFRCAWAWNRAGHLFGRQIGAYNVPAKVTNPHGIVFFPKHIINVIEVLMEAGILKDD